MKSFVFVTLSSLLIASINGQQCQARFNPLIVGQCSSIDNCQGTILSGNSCQQQRCCVSALITNPPTCLTTAEFDVFYNNTVRARYLRSVLNMGLSRAGICSDCQSKAAFLAIAAAMTNDFQTDESTQSESELSAEDFKYGNNRTGDGSRFRRRGLFGLRGRTMYQRLQTFIPQYQPIENPESVAIVENAIQIASLLWNNPTLMNGKID